MNVLGVLLGIGEVSCFVFLQDLLFMILQDLSFIELQGSSLMDQ